MQFRSSPPNTRHSVRVRIAAPRRVHFFIVQSSRHVSEHSVSFKKGGGGFDRLDELGQTFYFSRVLSEDVDSPTLRLDGTMTVTVGSASSPPDGSVDWAMVRVLP